MTYPKTNHSLPCNRRSCDVKLSCKLKQLYDNENSVCNRTRKHKKSIGFANNFRGKCCWKWKFDIFAHRDYLNFLNLYTFSRRRVKDTFFPNFINSSFFRTSSVQSISTPGSFVVTTCLELFLWKSAYFQFISREQNIVSINEHQ